MELNLIALAIPAFLVLIGAELVASLALGRRDIYRWNDAVSDLACGIGNQVTGIAFKVITLGVYTAIWARFGAFELGLDSPVAWILTFLWVDFSYYWWHRASHEVNFMWAAHVVHHQSPDYNLAVALRQALFTGLTSLPFYLPMAFLGVHPAVYAANISISLLYQFWIHTQLIGKLGPLEWVMNTPSHHRVHHGVNPRYLDKNYAGILIVWDRMFGTFEVETEPVVYGTVKTYESLNPLWANVDLWVHMAREARAAASWGDALRVFVARPDWRPANLKPFPPAPEVHPSTSVKYDPPAGAALNAYTFAQFAPLIAGISGMLLVEHDADVLPMVAGGAGIIATTVTVAALLESRPWARAAEFTRLALAPAVALCWTASPGILAAVIGWAGVSAVCFAFITVPKPSLRESPA